MDNSPVMKPPLLCKELVNKQEDVKHIKGVLYSPPVVVESLQYITGLLFSSSNKIPEVKKKGVSSLLNVNYLDELFTSS